MAERFGNQLLEEGYRGYFDLDFLIDQDNGEVYLGELNPRVCGASPMTNHAALCLCRRAAVPLPPARVLGRAVRPQRARNQRALGAAALHRFVVAGGDEVHRQSRRPGHARARHRHLPHERRRQRQLPALRLQPQAIDSEREAFFLRITGPGDYRYEGADLGILITRGRSMDDNFKLNLRARDWIRGIKHYYAGKPIVTTQHEAAPEPGAFKIL
jgi:hypothetical protein